MFVGYFPDILRKFKKSESLLKVCSYLNEALDEESEVYHRITHLGANESLEVCVDEGIKSIEQAYYTKSPKEAFYESHQEMVDFQMLLKGREIFFVAPHSLCEIKNPYNRDKDLIEYYPNIYASTLLLFRGNLAVFEANDVHAGGIFIGQSELVQKIVVKIPQKLIKLNF
ncbi:YhcH/YjgK/YiaL family protein [Helicobacter apodemus]|uniref:YhcH/YjgK/YiaL family protein n=1 Tax=Helicobacter apodemus TaxID=135569 RepID=A0A4U8UE27_9HELI|nr:YhcH/YjgK/YiaL family protein [Helicobacter apodemus]TLE15623.1 YhcH/YjgK/YiaL family protein [Helicobacter apodemus]